MCCLIWLIKRWILTSLYCYRVILFVYWLVVIVICILRLCQSPKASTYLLKPTSWSQTVCFLSFASQSFKELVLLFRLEHLLTLRTWTPLSASNWASFLYRSITFVTLLFNSLFLRTFYSFSRPFFCDWERKGMDHFLPRKMFFEDFIFSSVRASSNTSF
jgi:hypothetical protein